MGLERPVPTRPPSNNHPACRKSSFQAAPDSGSHRLSRPGFWGQQPRGEECPGRHRAEGQRGTTRTCFSISLRDASLPPTTWNLLSLPTGTFTQDNQKAGL